MLCQAVTQGKPERGLLTARLSRPCPAQAVANGYCQLHHPSIRLAKLRLQRNKLGCKLGAISLQIDEVQAELARFTSTI